MKTTHCLSIAILLAATSLVVPSLKAVEPRQDINPALLYWQAFSIFPELSESNRVSLYWENPWAPLTAVEIETARLFDPSFKLIRRAEHMQAPCDWGLDLADGPDMVAPNIIKIRQTAQATQLRARVALAEGKSSEAVEEIGAMLKLARHSAQDGFLVQVMVQTTLEEDLVKFIAQHFAAWSPEALDKLLGFFDGKPDRITTAQAVVYEKRIFHEWMLSRLNEIINASTASEEETLEKALAFWEEYDWGKQSLELIRGRSGGTGKGLIDALQQSAQLYEHMAAVASASPAQWESRRLSYDRYVESDALGQLFAPNIGKARAVELRLVSRLAMLHAAVSLKKGGPQSLSSTRDPFGVGPFSLREATAEGGKRGFELQSALTLPNIDPALFFGDDSIHP